MVVVSPAAANGKKEGPMSGGESAGEMNHNNIYTQQDMACYLCICQNILFFFLFFFFVIDAF